MLHNKYMFIQVTSTNASVNVQPTVVVLKTLRRLNPFGVLFMQAEVQILSTVIDEDPCTANTQSNEEVKSVQNPIISFGLKVKHYCTVYFPLCASHTH